MFRANLGCAVSTDGEGKSGSSSSFLPIASFHRPLHSGERLSKDCTYLFCVYTFLFVLCLNARKAGPRNGRTVCAMFALLGESLLKQISLCSVE